MAIPISMPRQGQSVETCVITEWLKKIGDKVSKGDVLFSYETDKASFEFESPVSGTLLATFFEKGADVPVLTNVAVIGESGETYDQFSPTASSSISSASQAGSVTQAGAGGNTVTLETMDASSPVLELPASDGVIKISPRARKRAEEKGIAIASVAGSGPGGRIIERDIHAVSTRAALMTKTAQAKSASENLAAPMTGTGIGGRVRSEDLTAATTAPAQRQALPQQDEYTDVAITKIRALIAQRMMQSLSQSAQLTMTSFANASGLVALRKKLKEQRDTLGIENITINDLVAFSLCRVLPQFPDLNTLYIDGVLRRYKHVHLAVAVDTPRGLMVPVVRFADSLSINEMARQVKSLAQQCNDGSINPDYLTGGTITISNLGVYGIESFTPVLNPPQVALLGVNTIAPRPIQNEEGQYGFAPHIGLSLTIDHRYVDGAPAARFLQALCKAIENIEITIACLK